MEEVIFLYWNYMGYMQQKWNFNLKIGEKEQGKENLCRTMEKKKQDIVSIEKWLA